MRLHFSSLFSKSHLLFAQTARPFDKNCGRYLRSLKCSADPPSSRFCHNKPEKHPFLAPKFHTRHHKQAKESRSTISDTRVPSCEVASGNFIDVNLKGSLNFEERFKQIKENNDRRIVAEVIKDVKKVEDSSIGWTEHKIITRLTSVLRAWHGKLNCYHVNMVLNVQKNPEIASSFFNWANSQSHFRPNVLVYNTMIRILGRAKKFEIMEECFKDMVNRKCNPDIVTLTEMIKSYSFGNRYSKAVESFNRLKRFKLTPNAFTYSVLIDLHGQQGYYDEALAVYKEMGKKDIKIDTVTATTVINLYGKMNKIMDAEDLFEKMCKSSNPPNIYTYNSMLDIYQKSWNLNKAVDLFNEMYTRGFNPDMTTYCIMLSVYLKLESMAGVSSLRNEMTLLEMAPNDVWYNTLAEYYLRIGDYARFNHILEEMQKHCVKMDVISYTLQLIACLNLRKYYQAAKIIKIMTERGFLPNLRVYNNLMQAFTHCDDANDSRLILSMMADINHPIHELLQFLLQKKAQASIKSDKVKSRIRPHLKSLLREKFDQRCSYVNFLVDHLVKRKQFRVAEILLQELPGRGFLKPVLNHTSSEWCLDLRNFSQGMAVMLLRSKLLDLYEVAEDKERVFPQKAVIITGTGKHRRSNFDTIGLRDLLLMYLWGLESPFCTAGDSYSTLECDGSALKLWLLKPGLVQALGSLTL